jgi:hypothetical protein
LVGFFSYRQFCAIDLQLRDYGLSTGLLNYY